MDRFDWIELKGTPAPEPRARPKRAPHDAPTFYDAARRLREAAHLQSAAQCYERVLGLDPHNFNAGIEWVDTLVRCGAPDTADAVSARLHDEFRRVRILYAARALALAYNGQLHTAFSLSDISLEGDTHWYASVVRAELILKASAEQHSEARECLEQALLATNIPWEVHFLGGWMLLAAGHPALAAAYFSEAVHCRPAAIAGHIGLGDAFSRLRLHDQALFYYQRAIELEPQHELALARQRECTPRLYGLTRIFRREDLRKRWNKALQQYEARPSEPHYDF